MPIANNAEKDTLVRKKAPDVKERLNTDTDMPIANNAEKDTHVRKVYKDVKNEFNVSISMETCTPVKAHAKDIMTKTFGNNMRNNADMKKNMKLSK